jgi:hypothetical protein
MNDAMFHCPSGHVAQDAERRLEPPKHAAPRTTGMTGWRFPLHLSRFMPPASFWNPSGALPVGLTRRRQAPETLVHDKSETKQDFINGLMDSRNDRAQKDSR